MAGIGVISAGRLEIHHIGHHTRQRIHTAGNLIRVGGSIHEWMHRNPVDGFAAACAAKIDCGEWCPEEISSGLGENVLGYLSRKWDVINEVFKRKEMEWTTN